MLAALAHPDQTRFALEELPVPELEPGDVLVRVHVAGLTHGLLRVWQAGRIPLLPAVLSQEIAGVVAEVGPGVDGVTAGDRVRVHSVLSCRECAYCRAGDEMWCDQVSLIGHAAYSQAAMPLYSRYHNGGLAEYVKVPEWSLDRLPDGLSFAAGAKVHSLSVSYQALRRADPRPGGTVIVTGATGAQGAAAIRLAPAFGVERVIAVSRTRANLERARQLAPPGLVEALPLEELPEGWQTSWALPRRLRELNRGRPADALLDFLPDASEVTAHAITALRKGGQAVLLGGNWGQLSLPYGLIMTNGWGIRGCQGGSRQDALGVLELLGDGRLEVGDLISHRYTLDRVNEAVETIQSRRAAPLLVVVDVAGEETER